MEEQTTTESGAAVAAPVQEALPVRPPGAKFGVRTTIAALKAAFGPVKTIVDEAAFNAPPEATNELRIMAVDPAHVAMIASVLPIFTTVPGRVGVNMEKLWEAVKVGKAKDSVDLTIDGDDFISGDNLQLGAMTVKVGALTQRKRLIDTTGIVDPKAPRLDLPGRFTILTKDLLTALRAANDVSDHVTITADEAGVTFLAEGEVDRAEQRMDRALLAAHAVPERCSSKFSLDYLVAMVRTIAVSSVEVELGNDFPMRMRWGLPGEDEKYGHVWLLAPRIESS